jgi:hypothetical protein
VKCCKGAGAEATTQGRVGSCFMSVFFDVTQNLVLILDCPQEVNAVCTEQFSG